MKIIAMLTVLGACTLNPEMQKDVQVLEEDAGKLILDAQGLPQQPVDKTVSK